MSRSHGRARWAWGLAALLCLGPVGAAAAAPVGVDPDRGSTVGGTPTSIAMPATANRWEDVSAGSGFSVGLTSDGTVYAWGIGTLGQLGNGSTESSNTPVAVDASGVLAGKTITQVSAGGTHAAALASDGTVYTWGQGAQGRLGNGSTVSSAVPVAVDTGGVLAGTTITQVAAGYMNTVALASDGTVYTWGHGTRGHLGNGAVESSAVPVAVDMTGELAGKVVSQVANGSNAMAALASDGTVYAWGDASMGLLGTDTTQLPALQGLPYSAVPVAVDMSGELAGQRVAHLAVGIGHMVAATSDGTVYTWGYNSRGQLGIGTTGNSAGSDVPVAVDTSGVLGGVFVTEVSATEMGSFALSADGAVYGWGDGRSGQLGEGNGDGNPSSGTDADSNVPVAVDMSGALAGRSVVHLSGLIFHSAVLADDGAVYSWGSGSNGQQGNGGNLGSPSPARLPGPGASVTFGQAPATSVTWSGQTALLARTPAHAPGQVDVHVQLGGATGPSFAFPQAFLFGAAPQVVTSPVPEQRVAQGEPLDLVAVTSGDPVPTAEWQVRGGDGTWGPAPGEASALVSDAELTSTLAIDTSTVGDMEFRAVFTNALGEATSAVAFVTVTEATPRSLSARVESDRVVAGGSQTVLGKGFSPGESVAIVLRSDPTPVGTVVADADGGVRHTFTVPANTAPGLHTVTLTGALSGAVSAEFSVVAPAAGATPGPGAADPDADGDGGGAGWLASTGAMVALSAVLAAALIGGGTALVRRRASAH